MTDFLLRTLIGNTEETTNPAVRTAVGKLAGVVGIVCNLLLFAMKLVIGIVSRSVSITADAFNNLSDIASGVIALAGFAIAAKPPDKEHPYGHARFEYISGLAVAGLILVVGSQFAMTSLRKILVPQETSFGMLMVPVLLLSMAVKMWLFFFYKKTGDRIASTSLRAAGKDARNDVLTTGAVLAAALIEYMTGVYIDGFAGLLVSVLIILSCIQIARETISPLLGENADPETVHLLSEKILKSDPRVLGIHDLMVHDYGPGQRFATVHVETDAREDALAAHELIDRIERRIREEDHIQLLIHHDPVVTDDPEQNHLHRMIDKLLSRMDARMQLHDFRIGRNGETTRISFDLVRPADCRVTEEEIEKSLQQVLDREDAKYVLDIVFDTQSFNEF
ncbi:MAG: cation transporter [Lachnospiraceae bacterium]|nr:cation transporter [Lachnospiraceae bacterium]